MEISQCKKHPQRTSYQVCFGHHGHYTEHHTKCTGKQAVLQRDTVGGLLLHRGSLHVKLNVDSVRADQTSADGF